MCLAHVFIAKLMREQRVTETGGNVLHETCYSATETERNRFIVIIRSKDLVPHGNPTDMYSTVPTILN